MGFIVFAEFLKSFGLPVWVNLFPYLSPVAIISALFYFLIIKR